MSLVVGGLALALVLHVGYGGQSGIGPIEVVRILTGQGSGIPGGETIVFDLRLARSLGALLVGAILGAAGTGFQAYFRNPLAEPYVIGVSSGAAAGGATAIFFGLGAIFAPWGIFIGAVLGALATLAFVTALAGKHVLGSQTRLLLSGVIVGGMLGGLVSALMVLSGQDSNRILGWLLGSLSNLQRVHLPILAVACVGLFAVLFRWSRELNVLALGDLVAQQSGANIRQVRGWVLYGGSVAVAMSVGLVGMIGFLGLIAPHLARLSTGPDVRKQLFASSVWGATLLLLADLAAVRTIRATELPVGAITAVLGAPLLLYLLTRRQSRNLS
ncbi:MAG: iron ABC transporter permease [Armatimonadetes bacterium]|nr:iron ABC transporter permease [Armatimonadota bacterium]